MIAKELAEQLLKMEGVLATQRLPLKIQVGSRFYDLEDTVLLNVDERALVIKVKRKVKLGKMSDD